MNGSRWLAEADVFVVDHALRVMNFDRDSSLRRDAGKRG